MEGFIGQRQVIARPSRRVGGDSSMLQRWLFFLFVVLLGMAAVAALARELAIGAG